MDVFAYLPLRSFGFKFIIQADFAVPASRQDLNQDSSWNQWLVKHIPALFVKALALFREKFEALEAIKAYLRFIPLESEILGIFQHIPRQVFELLRQEAFLPVLDPSSGQIIWKKPFECVLVNEDSAAICELLTPDLLQLHLGRFYLHSSLLTIVDAHLKSLLLHLGLRQLALSDIADILKSVLLASDKSHYDMVWIAKWLVVLYHCLHSNTKCSIMQEDAFLGEQFPDFYSINLVKKIFKMNLNEQIFSYVYIKRIYFLILLKQYQRLLLLKLISIQFLKIYTNILEI